MDRSKVEWDDVSSLKEGTLPWRIWANTRVKCANHAHGCLWRGEIVDFRNHAEDCAHEIQLNSSSNSSILQELHQYKKLNITLQNTIRQQEGEIDALRIQLGRIGGEPDVDALGLFDGSYDYEREDTVMLSPLISLRLNSKPYHIDSNKIFNCVQARFCDWEAGYVDNPLYYDIDMKMLLATCNATEEWFSMNQKKRIEYMLKRIFS